MGYISSISNLHLQSIRPILGHMPMCSCSACRSGNSFNASTQAQNSTTAMLQGTPAIDNQNGNVQPQQPVYPVPTPEEVKNDPTIQRVLAKLPIPLIKKGEGEPPVCITNSAQEIPPDHPSLVECLGKEQITKDISRAKSSGHQIIFLYDPLIHGYFEIMNETGTQLPLSKLIELVNKKFWVRAYIDGVFIHERLHKDEVEEISDARVEKFEEGIKVTISNTVLEPKFEVSTFGQSVFDASRIDDGVTEAENFFGTAQANFAKAQAQNFANWTEQTFNSLVNSLKACISKLQFLAQETNTLALAAVAPLALHDTIYYEHEALSEADIERYQEARQLKDYVLDLANKIQNFINQVTQAWQGTRPSVPAGTPNNLVGLLGSLAPQKQAA
jgi:hypothetical protein